MHDQIQADLKAAMIARDSLKSDVLKSLKTALMNAKIEKKDELSEDEIIKVLRKAAKQRQEAADMFGKAGSSEQQEKELKEKEMIEVYLPAQMGEDKIGEIVDEVLAELGEGANQGQAMGMAMKKVAGQADGGLVAKIVKEKLLPSAEAAATPEHDSSEPEGESSDRGVA